MTWLIAWLCGAVPLAIFCLTRDPPHGREWIGFTLIVLFWPLFLLWCVFGGKKESAR